MQEKKITMTEMFKGYSSYSEEEYKRIWNNALIVTDTNILLNFYRCSEDAKNEIFKILAANKNRLWIPYHVGQEYFYCRNKVMSSAYNEYDDMISSFKKKFEEARGIINKRKNNQLECKSKIYNIIDDSLEQIKKLLLDEKDKKKPKFQKNEIEDEIIKIFDRCIGENFEEQEYEKVKKEGDRRLREKIPPGFRDEDKEENGDYYIFYSLIRKSKNDNKDIIFITDDVKDDWFNIYKGEKHGGRNELLNEFYKETGNLLLIYTSDGFLKKYNENKSEPDKAKMDKIIKELINIRKKEYIKEKAYLSHPSDREEVLNYLSSMVRKLDISDFQNLELYKKSSIFKRNNYSDSDILKLLKFIALENNKDRYPDEKYKNRLLDDIKNHYLIFISELESCKSNEEQEKIYKEICNCVRKHLKILEQLPPKYQNDISFNRLLKLLETIYIDLDKREKQRKVIEQLELYVK